MARPHVVIIGAGFGGLACAHSLKDESVSVTVIDRNNYHLFTPLLYQVATSLLNPSDIAQPVRAILRGATNIRFRQGTVTGIDFEARTVQLASSDPVPYDYLVIATGSESNYFGMADLAAQAFELKDLPDAMEIRNHILHLLERAAGSSDPAERARLLTFTVVGGGPTGVEYAGALSELMRLIVPHEYPELGGNEISILLLEGQQQVLAGFDQSSSDAAARELRGKGIELRFGALVQAFDGHEVTLASGETIGTETVIWAAGVRPSGLVQALDVQKSRSRRIDVTPDLRIRGMRTVFAIGDVASVEHDGTELAMLAQPAMQEGRHAADTILRLQRCERTRRFRYRDRGRMATIGRNAGVAEVGRVKLSGFLGWVAWLVVHLYFIIGLRNRLAVLLNWAWNYLRYDRPVRIIARAATRHEDSRSADTAALPGDRPNGS